MTALFDRKLGRDFMVSVPPVPGVYRVYDIDSHLIYVGKAKNLRRRLGQYRNAKRRKKSLKMRKIIQETARIEIETCATDLEAILLETQLIQLYRPKLNVVGAFSFLYPLIGMRSTEAGTFFCYTTEPDLLREFDFHGAFRSRHLTREAFFALMELVSYVGHRLPRARTAKSQPTPLPKYSYLYGFRQFPSEWLSLWTQFWKGESKACLESLVLALVENAGARKRPKEVQEQLNHLSRFWRHEALPLAKARAFNEYPHYPVAQKDRDLIFLIYRQAVAGKSVGSQVASRYLAKHSFTR